MGILIRCSLSINIIKGGIRKLQKITKEEAMAIRENLRGVHVTMTNRQSKAKARTFYCEESPYVNKFLERLRKNQKVEHFE